MKQRIQLVDFLKGVGIVSVVLGHTCRGSIPIVYTYHLFLFFFVSGYVYNSEKYEHDIKRLFHSRFWGIYGKYLLYSALMLLFNNLLFVMGIYEDSLSIEQIAIKLVSLVYLSYTPPISPATWYITASIQTAVMFGVVYSISVFIGKKSKVVFNFSIIFLSIICATIGLLLLGDLPHRFDISLCMIPIAYCGYFCKLYWKSIQPFCKFIFTIPCVVFCIASVSYFGSSFDLSFSNIIHPLFLYPISLSAIYVWLTIYSIFEKYIPKVIDFFSFIGGYSLDIMLLHVVFVKLVDFIYSHFIIHDVSNLSRIVYSYQNLWPIYLLTGVAGPILTVKFFKFLGKFISNRINMELSKCQM